MALVVKSLPANAGDSRECRFDPLVRKIPWSRKQQPTPVFLPGKFHGQRGLVGYTPWGLKQSNTTGHTWAFQITLSDENTSTTHNAITVFLSFAVYFCFAFREYLIRDGQSKVLCFSPLEEFLSMASSPTCHKLAFRFFVLLLLFGIPFPNISHMIM